MSQKSHPISTAEIKSAHESQLYQNDGIFVGILYQYDVISLTKNESRRMENSSHLKMEEDYNKELLYISTRGPVLRSIAGKGNTRVLFSRGLGGRFVT